MRYRIRAAQGFSLEADDAATALGYAKAAERGFPPVEIWGPDGQLTLEELRRHAQRSRRRG